MLKLWDLYDTFEKWWDKMKNMIELDFFNSTEPLLLKDLQIYFSPNRDLFWGVKIKNGDFVIKQIT